jgi:hypothetical protein
LRQVAGPGLSGDDSELAYRSARQWAAWFALPSNYCRRTQQRQVEVTKQMAEGYLTAPAGFLGKMRVSLLSILNALAPLTRCEEDWLSAQKGQTDYQVAALMLWARTATERKCHAIACKMAKVPLDMWLDEESNLMTVEIISRQACHAEGGGDGAHILLARCKTLTGRDLRSHDVDAEIKSRSQIETVHYYDTQKGYDREGWCNDMQKTLTRLVESSLNPGNTFDQDENKWSKTRALWMPQGSSSQPKSHGRECLAEKFQNDKAINRTKKMAWFDRNLSLQELLAKTPGLHCRAATKNEPGQKRRALHAADDISFLMAAYVSSGMEKTMSQGGAVMRQRPSDVQETAQNAIACGGRKWILCIDYSDFNKTHTVTSRYMLSRTIAQTLRKCGARKRAHAAEWMALAHLNHTLNGHMVNQGLSSGERDTARDNTLLHVAYSKMAIRPLRHECPTLETAVKRFCGDDEIVIGLDWYDAVMYTKQLELQGHKIQQRKVMLSRNHGEFLQYNFSSDYKTPTQPLAPALINFISGSWYKRTVYEKTAIPQQVSDSAAGLWRRGLSYKTATQLAISSSSWLCAGLPWKNLLMSTNLFGGKQIPEYKFKKEVEPVYAHAPAQKAQAVKDMFSWINSQYPDLPKELSGIETANQLRDQAYGAVIGRATKFDLEHDYEDATLVDVPPEPHIDSNHMCKTWCTTAAGERLDPMDMAAMQAGLPVQWLRGKHGHTIMKLLPNSVQKNLNIQDPPGWKLQPAELASLPGAIVAYATRSY